MRVDTDFLIIGTGVAGLTLALELSKHGTVTCVTKRTRQDSATNYAQGGIAAVLDPDDSFAAHVADTLTTGGGLSHLDVVEMVIADGPARIEELMKIGAEFSRQRDSDGNETVDFDLTREGGHSARRVIHAGDITGREVQRALVAAVEAQPRITLLEHHMAIDLLELSKFGGERRVAGAYVLDEESGEVLTFVARATVLATGGAGKVYLYTSNPDVATGDGVAMAYRAGARGGEHGVLPVPPHVPVPPAGQELPHQRGPARRGRHPAPDGTAFMKSGTTP
jgi:L-aspartate oxidase